MNPAIYEFTATDSTHPTPEYTPTRLVIIESRGNKVPY